MTARLPAGELHPEQKESRTRGSRGAGWSEREGRNESLIFKRTDEQAGELWPPDKGRELVCAP